MIEVTMGLAYEDDDAYSVGIDSAVIKVWWKFLVPEIAKENESTVLGVFLCKENCNRYGLMSVTSNMQLPQLLPNNISNSRWKRVVQNLITEPRLYFSEMNYDYFKNLSLKLKGFV